MIKIVESDDGFKFYYKDYLFLTHTTSQPCIKIGIGSARYRSKLGEFKIREKLSEEIPLKNFKIIFNSEKDMNIFFEYFHHLRS